MGNHLVGVIAYADDIILVYPTTKSLDILTGICEVYADTFSIPFGKKSIFLVFKGRTCVKPNTSMCMYVCMYVCRYVCGDKIKSDCTYYLGHRISTKDKEYMQVCNC